MLCNTYLQAYWIIEKGELVIPLILFHLFTHNTQTVLHRSIESFYNDRPLITTITKHFLSTYCDNHQPVLGHLLRQSSTTSWESSLCLPSLETDNITWHLICFLWRFCRASIFCSLDSCEPVNIVLVLCSFYVRALLVFIKCWVGFFLVNQLYY